MKNNKSTFVLNLFWEIISLDFIIILVSAYAIDLCISQILTGNFFLAEDDS